MRRSIILAMFLSFLAKAQDVAPPPKPTDDGPSLEVIIRFIKDKLIENASAKWKLTVSNSSTDGSGFTWITNRFAEIKDAPESCGLSYRMTRSQDPPSQVNSDETYRIAFKLVKSLTITNFEEYSNSEGVNSQPELSFDITPPIYALVINFSQGDPQVLPFDDEEMAHRVARAMLRAVELCGGGD
jgi:hypothetical protein